MDVFEQPVRGGKKLYLVVADSNAEDCKKELVSKFPRLSIHAALKQEDIP